jgi:hypothetical protein
VNRHAIIEMALRHAEQDLSYTTRWLIQCDDPAYPRAAENRAHFLKLRHTANDRYARALKLSARLKPRASTVVLQMELNL